MTICVYKQRFYKQVAAYSIALFLATGCSGDNDNEPGVLDSLSAIKHMADESPDIEKRIEALSKLTPLDFATLKALLPETLLDLPQREMSGTEGDLTGLQVRMSTALYGDSYNEEHNHDTRSLKLYIQDGAGETGSATLGLLYAAQAMVRGFGTQTEDDGSYTKIISLQGFDVLEKMEKPEDGGTRNCLNAIPGTRFVVSLCSENLDMETLKTAFLQIDFGTMKKLAESE